MFNKRVVSDYRHHMLFRMRGFEDNTKKLTFYHRTVFTITRRTVRIFVNFFLKDILRTSTEYIKCVKGSPKNRKRTTKYFREMYHVLNREN